MTPNEYQKLAARTAVYPECRAIEYLVIGLASEAGEVAGVVKKSIRSGQPIDPDRVCDELGDVLWYVAEIASRMNLSLETVMSGNIDKLSTRIAGGRITVVTCDSEMTDSPDGEKITGGD